MSCRSRGRNPYYERAGKGKSVGESQQQTTEYDSALVGLRRSAGASAYLMNSNYSLGAEVLISETRRLANPPQSRRCQSPENLNRPMQLQLLTILMFACGAIGTAQAGSIRKAIEISVPPETVWDAVSDFAHADNRLVPGFITELKMDGSARIVTFANGVTVKEILVTNDKVARRLVYAVVGGQLTHHSASIEVRPHGTGRTLLVWITDFLPDSYADYIQEQMDGAAAIMKGFLESQRRR